MFWGASKFTQGIRGTSETTPGGLQRRLRDPLMVHGVVGGSTTGPCAASQSSAIPAEIMENDENTEILVISQFRPHPAAVNDDHSVWS